jgi:AcrR family transcriptional regulator
MDATGVARGGVLGRDGVTELQRARIVAAITELVPELGVSGVTVAQIVERSQVSRRTFYELYGNTHDCLLAAFEHALAHAAAIVMPAYEAAGTGPTGPGPTGAETNGALAPGARAKAAGDPWEEGIRAGLAALLTFLDAKPAMARLMVVDALAGDRRVLQRRARVVEALIDAVHQGGKGPGGAAARRPPRIVAEGAVGAVLAVIHARLCEPDPKPLARLLNQLVGMIVLPYRGAEAVERELRHRAPQARRRAPEPADPLRKLNMRFTYRTLRVLLAIAELGGGAGAGGRAPSSREVADAAGVSDQGQISKLLWRLERLGLIANGVELEARGVPNAWRLTPRGQEVQRVIRAQTGGEQVRAPSKLATTLIDSG